MAHKKYGVKTREWHKHLRDRYGTKRPQERLVRADGKRQIRDEDLERECPCCR